MAAGSDAETDAMDWTRRSSIDASWSGPYRAYSTRCCVLPRGAEAPSDLWTDRTSFPIARAGGVRDGECPESVPNTQGRICAGSSSSPDRIFGPAVCGFHLGCHGVDAAETFHLLLAQGRKSLRSGRQHRRRKRVFAPASGPLQGKLSPHGRSLQRRSGSRRKLSLCARERANSRLRRTGFIPVQKIQR